jgi:pimeloyl-ACP methyl ester carboxylesterase
MRRRARAARTLFIQGDNTMPNTYHTIGQGEHKIIALHGWFGHAGGWGPMTDHLDGQRFSYAFMDYRGYGAMKGSGGPYTMAQIAQDALALADHLGWPRFSLIGHSMGGLAIQQVLAQAPQRVRALVGVTPVPASGVPFDDAGWGFFSSAAHNAGARRESLDLTTGKRLSGVWLDAMVRSSQAHSNVEAFDAYLTAWAKTNILEQIKGKNVPVLVIAGENDPALGPDTCKATWMQHHPQARLEIMSNAGHYPMDETPLALTATIERWLAALA